MRRRRKRFVERYGALSKPIQMWRDRPTLMPIANGHGVLLIGHKDQDVRPFMPISRAQNTIPFRLEEAGIIFKYRLRNGERFARHKIDRRVIHTGINRHRVS